MARRPVCNAGRNRWLLQLELILEDDFRIGLEAGAYSAVFGDGCGSVPLAVQHGAATAAADCVNHIAVVRLERESLLATFVNSSGIGWDDGSTGTGTGRYCPGWNWLILLPPDLKVQTHPVRRLIAVSHPPPVGTAGSKAIPRISPVGVSPFKHVAGEPEPVAVAWRVALGLYGQPVSALLQSQRLWQVYGQFSTGIVWREIVKGLHFRPRLAVVVRVKKHVDIIRRGFGGIGAIPAECIDLFHIPCFAVGHSEVISRLRIEFGVYQICVSGNAVSGRAACIVV